MRLCTLLLLFLLQNGLRSLMAPLPINENVASDDMYKDYPWAWRTMINHVAGWFSSSNTDQTFPSSTAPPSSNLLDIDITNQAIPRPSPSDEKLPILEKENTIQEEHSELDSHTTHQPIPSPTSADIETSSSSDRLQEMDNHSVETKASATTGSDSHSNALLSTTSPEHFESTQASVVEEEEEQKEEEKLHEEQSETLTTPIPTPPPAPSIAPIYDPTAICHSNSTCYVYPENCSLNCNVVYAWKSGESAIYVRRMFTYGVISIKSSLENDDYRLFSCFEHAGFCAYGSEGFNGVLSYRIRYPIYPSRWVQLPENKYLITINSPHPVVPFGKGRKIEFRLDANRDVGGEFQELFLKSKE
ncbi:hypothetical protein B9Z55_025976 [Caenorhabditis nigoni]|uniref:Uncharacterized protein n=1 Tax=Caenorhabditis nigoni TaxID=1611254 RepID=A0A2G5T188_9PELO|nr:hypothetical protein B9Z55_025976 [Caenorhabditis nigoni]